MSLFPDIGVSSKTFIKPLQVSPNELPLKLRLLHGKREFKVTLKLADNENGARISMRHLAEVVLQQTGVEPSEQSFYFRGVSWSNPDLSPWSPPLRDLGLKNGDKVQLLTFHHPTPDWEEIAKLEALEKRFKKIKTEVHLTFYRLHGVNHGYVESGNQLMALASIRQSVDMLKEKLMLLIKDLNDIHLDHRNCEGQARRRETVDNAQRQLDKCQDVAASIFHKLAQSQQMSNVGALYPGDPMQTVARGGRGNPRRRS